jgi:hypothetical protein
MLRSKFSIIYLCFESKRQFFRQKNCESNLKIITLVGFIRIGFVIND